MPLAGSVAEAIVFGPPSPSVSLANTLIVVALESSATVAASSTATGGSSTAVTVIDTVAVLLSRLPSFTLYVNESEPLKFEFGVYVTLAVSVLGEPAVQLLFVMEPRLPLVGPDTIEKVSSHCCASEPESVIATGVSSLVETETAFAVGAVFETGAAYVAR